jgi:hypothetical protein
MSFTSIQTDTFGRKHVAIFDDPNSAFPTRRIVYAPDGTIESDIEEKKIELCPLIYD